MVYEGYSDWFLPAYAEAQFLYNNRGAIGGFIGGAYWVSTGMDANNAYYLDFSNGIFSSTQKTGFTYVRCIRKF